MRMPASPCRRPAATHRCRGIGRAVLLLEELPDATWRVVRADSEGRRTLYRSGCAAAALSAFDALRQDASAR